MSHKTCVYASLVAIMVISMSYAIASQQDGSESHDKHLARCTQQ